MNCKNILISILLSFLFINCGGGSGGGPVIRGTSSGGGGFEINNSESLLHIVADNLANDLRQANPRMFETLPGEWTNKKMAEIIENIEFKPDKVSSRHGKNLMFNYYFSGDVAKIEALKSYFVNYSSIPIYSITSNQPDILEAYKRDLRKKLLHELAHIIYRHDIKYTQNKLTVEKIESEAKLFALAIDDLIMSENYLCVFTVDDKDADSQKWVELQFPESLSFSNYVSLNDTAYNNVKAGKQDYHFFARYFLYSTNYLLINKRTGYGYFQEVFTPNIITNKSYANLTSSDFTFYEQQCVNINEAAKSGLASLQNNRFHKGLHEDCVNFHDYELIGLEDGKLQYKEANYANVGYYPNKFYFFQHIEETLVIDTNLQPAQAKLSYSGSLTKGPFSKANNQLTGEFYMSCRLSFPEYNLASPTGASNISHFHRIDSQLKHGLGAFSEEDNRTTSFKKISGKL